MWIVARDTIAFDLTEFITSYRRNKGIGLA